LIFLHYLCKNSVTEELPNKVFIPEVKRDDRIGSAFNQLFSVIHQTNKIDDKKIEWDFSNQHFFHPFFLAPLAIYKDNCKKVVTSKNQSKYISDYFKAIYFDNVYDASELSSKEMLELYLTKTYIPISRFTMKRTNMDKAQEILQDVMEHQSKVADNMKQPISYFLSELIMNIGEHSGSQYGYFFSQKVKSNLYIVIADVGRTIYGSYLETGKYLDIINGNEAKAMQIANEGYSTKDRPEAENRGYGISSSRRMIISLKGAFFMLSGKAFYRDDETGSQIVNLPNEFRWNGTIILLRIPLVAPKGFNIYSFVQ
jgi:hypothetical protein